EIARAYYVYTMMNDGTRRGARVAAVCPINDPAIARAAVYRALIVTVALRALPVEISPPRPRLTIVPPNIPS
ncbi:MAG: hypothetical protein P8172_17455, partial [Gammaproteobacteria bacterium]